MIKSRSIVGVVALSVVCAMPVWAQASELFAVNYDGSTPFFRVDQATGAMTVVNPLASTNVGDLTSDGRRMVWGVVLPNTLGFAPGNALVTFDPTSGSQTGSVPISFAGTDQNEARKITSLAYDPVGGKLYGNTTPTFGESGGVDKLFTIDPGTGVATFIGSIRAVTGAPFTDLFALGFTQGGGLYGVSNTSKELIKIDAATAQAQSVATLQIATGFDLASRPEDGKMFLADGFSGLNIYSVDVTNGALTLVGPYAMAAANNLVGLAFAVPEPETWALLAAGLAGVAFATSRRRRS